MEDKIREAFEREYPQKDWMVYHVTEDHYSAVCNLSNENYLYLNEYNLFYYGFRSGYASAMKSAQEEIERLKKENESLRCCGNCGRDKSGCLKPSGGVCGEWEDRV